MTRTPLSTLLFFAFKDPHWFKKLLILALLIFLSSVIPIIPLIFVVGYMARLARQMVVGRGEPRLPEWDDLGGIFLDGWRPFAVVVTYLIPVIIISIMVFLVMFLPLMASPSVWSGNNQNVNPGQLALILTTNLLGLAGIVFIGLASLVFTLFLPAVAVHSVVKAKYAAAFQFKEWWTIFAANLGGFFIVLGMSIVLNLAFGLISMVLLFTIISCCLLPFLTYGFTAYFYVVYAALCADAYRVGEEKGLASGKLLLGPPTPPAEPVSEVLPESTPESETGEESTPAVEAEAPAAEAKSDQTMTSTLSEEPEPAPKPRRKPKPAPDATLAQPTDDSQTLIQPPDAEAGEAP
jgi:hypothetical protein